MDDGEVVAAIAAGDPGGLAAAYDTYAAPLYGYCRWMLRDPGQAAEVLRETFAVAAAKLGGKDAGQLRAWLYATARDDCYRRLRTAEPGFDEGTGEDAGPDGAGSRTEQAVVRRVLREILADLKPEEHEVVELTVRHGLDESELATVLEVSWSRAHTLASQAREHLERALDALLIARTGRQSCPELGSLLAGWDGKLTVETGKLAARHIEHCPTCAGRRHGSLRPEVLARLLPLPALPAGLREPVLERAATRSASRAPEPETRVDLLTPVRSGRLDRIFSWDRIRANPGAGDGRGGGRAVGGGGDERHADHGHRPARRPGSRGSGPQHGRGLECPGRQQRSSARGEPGPLTIAPAEHGGRPGRAAHVRAHADRPAVEVGDTDAHGVGLGFRHGVGLGVADGFRHLHAHAETDAGAHADTHPDAHAHPARRRTRRHPPPRSRAVADRAGIAPNWPTFRPYAGDSTTVWAWKTGRPSRPSRQAT